MKTEEEKKAAKKAAWKKWYSKNRESELKRHRIYKEANKERLRQYRIRRKAENPEKWAERNRMDKRNGMATSLARQKFRYATEPNYRLARLMRCALWRNVQLGGVKHGRSKDYFGVDYGSLRTWIEMLFKPGMTWENHGKVWEIDHIVPLSRFDLTKEASAKAAWFYANLTPAWKADNRRKGNRYVGSQPK